MYNFYDPKDIQPHKNYWETDYVFNLGLQLHSGILANCHLFESKEQLTQTIKDRGWVFNKSTPISFLDVYDNTHILLYVNHYQLTAFPSSKLIKALTETFNDFDVVAFGCRRYTKSSNVVTRNLTCFKSETISTQTTTLMLTLYAKKTIYLPKQEC